ncbi:hypothetical protein SKAU_G00312090 [Synaphobranchus kaupii]|uniref:Uncharacterized protein n=1 Tax=Synaphobranchus kaupii TaxID=118154 RepID=A0A9Q1ERV8_SYNKA|nr:hypothetical protein SKAU_G00312090 [Synaphobranchus kaupii]
MADTTFPLLLPLLESADLLLTLRLSLGHGHLIPSLASPVNKQLCGPLLSSPCPTNPDTIFHQVTFALLLWSQLLGQQQSSRDERGYERTGERHTLTRICGTRSAQPTPPHAVGGGTGG